MAVQLDPFQLIVRANFPVIGAAENVGTVQVETRSDFTLTRCSGGTETMSGLWHHIFGTNDGDTLLSTITDCPDQAAFYIQGRTSGASAYLGFVERNPTDCNAGSTCFFPLGSNWARCSYEWLTFPAIGQADLNWSQYARSSFGFIDGERVDISFGVPPDKPITSITQISASVILVTATAHGLLDKAKCVIAGTADYDGIYNVHTTTADTFRIDRSYIADNTGGTVTAQYT